MSLAPEGLPSGKVVWQHDALESNRAILFGLPAKGSPPTGGEISRQCEATAVQRAETSAYLRRARPDKPAGQRLSRSLRSVVALSFAAPTPRPGRQAGTPPDAAEPALPSR